MNNATLFPELVNAVESTSSQEQVCKGFSSSSSNLENNVEIEVCDSDEFEDIDLDDYKHDYRTDDPALYVGTYAKYNNGDLTGAWISLAKCTDYDEFMRVCHCLHRDEGEDVELMFQDADNIPECWYCESGIDARTTWMVLCS